MESYFDSCFDAKKQTLDLSREWVDWYKKEGADRFLDEFNTWIEKKRIPFPCIWYSVKETQTDFKKLWNLKLEVNQEGWHHRFEYSKKFPYGSVFLRNSLAGSKLSRFFNTAYRARTAGEHRPSAYDKWHSPLSRRQTLNTLKLHTRDSKSRSITSTRLGSYFINDSSNAGYFKPAIAKQVYLLFNAERIYDFSTGWGDRLIAAYATPNVKLYVGTDPNRTNSSLYESICQSLSAMRPLPLAVQLCYLPAEDFEPHKIYGSTFDLVFTSCPYFSNEKYAKGTPHEHLQSWKRYETFASWFRNFLCMSLYHSLQALKVGGHLCLNIADYKSSQHRVEICDRLNEYLSQRGDLKYMFCLGLPLQVRYGCKSLGQAESQFAEPMWVWQKVK